MFYCLKDCVTINETENIKKIDDAREIDRYKDVQIDSSRCVSECVWDWGWYGQG